MDWNTAGAIGSVIGAVIGLVSFVATIWPYPQIKAWRSRSANEPGNKVSKLIALPVAASLVLSGITIYAVWHPWPREIESSAPRCYIISYGAAGTPGTLITPQNFPGFVVVTDGSYLTRYKDTYHVAAIAFHKPFTSPLDEVTGLSKSALYEIPDGRFSIGIGASAQYRSEMLTASPGTNYLLLLVPNKVTMDEFDTLKQAKTEGVIVLDTKSGPP